MGVIKFKNPRIKPAFHTNAETPMTMEQVKTFFHCEHMRVEIGEDGERYALISQPFLNPSLEAIRILNE